MLTAETLTAAEFLAAFVARRECCRALVELSAQQSTTIAHDDYTELLALLQHKQQLLEELWDAGRSAPPLGELWRGQRDQLSPAHRSACEAVLAETDDLLRQVLSTEESSASLLAARRDAVAEQLALLQQASTAASAYRGMAETEGQRRLDVGL